MILVIKKVYILVVLVWVLFGCGSSATNPTMSITTDTITLMANAGEDQKALVNQNVTLDGSNSNGKDITYKWCEVLDSGQCSKTLSTKAIWSLTQESKGLYIYRLTVSDTSGSKSDEVTVEFITDSISKVLKTGQNVSYADFDDGYYQKGLKRSYTRNDIKKIVTDHSMGLQWQDDEDLRIYLELEEAKAYCQNLELDGGGWYLPTIQEIQTLTDYYQENRSINEIFKQYPSCNSTIDASNALYTWRVSLSIYGITDRTRLSTCDVSCVRAMEQFEDISHSDLNRSFKGVVTDNITHLQWQDDYSNNNGDIKNATWQNAIEYCESLVLDGDDWRLPNRNELLTIVDYQHFDPAIGTEFEHSISQRYWSSTTDIGNTNFAWVIWFGKGNSNFLPKSYDNSYVRCVRNAGN